MGRTCILLQGPVGGLFSCLKAALRAAGFAVVKINFNAGDEAYGTADDIRFDLAPELFAGWFRSLLQFNPGAVVFGFGDERGPHRVARAVCRDAGVPILFFEEGYIRPGFVALEPGGNNASSAMRWCELGDDASALHPVPPARTSFPQMAAAAAKYWIAMRLGRRRFPLYHHHYETVLLREGASWIRLAAVKALTARRSRTAVAALLAPSAKPFALLLLQLDTDLQIRAHGRGWTAANAIEKVVASFAAHAAPDMKLVVKAHPFERRRDLARLLARCAAAAGIADRVVFLNQGSLRKLLSRANSVVTINSTGGLGALEAGVPVLTLGEAIYARPGLAQFDSHHGLDAFWITAAAPDRGTWLKFRHRLIEDVLLPGSFYRKDGWDRLCDLTIARIHDLKRSRPARPGVRRERADA